MTQLTIIYIELLQYYCNKISIILFFYYNIIEIWLYGNGPELIVQNETYTQQEFNCDLTDEEKKTFQVNTVTIKTTFLMDLCKQFSSFRFFRRVVSYMLRYIKDLRFPTNKNLATLSAEELSFSLRSIIKSNQELEFNKQLLSLKNNLPISKTSKLIKLGVILDENGLIRIRGRIDNCSLTYEEKYPLVISECHFSKLLVRHTHESNFHSGISLTISLIRRRYWILNLRKLVKFTIKNCINCTRYRTSVSKYIPGQLPSYRFDIDFPFTNTGIDYAGPITLRPFKCRGKMSCIGFIVIFVCLVTKAVNLELAMSIDTESFFLAFKRFISRRGMIKLIVCDNGRNFLGAKNELNRLGLLLDSQSFQSAIENHASDNHMQWKFIPAYSPSFGGLWESNVKSVKSHLKRTYLGKTLTVEEFNTSLCQIESLLNSRLLAPLTDDDPHSFILTQGHFLLGRSMSTFPDNDFSEDGKNLTKRFFELKRLIFSFWNDWKGSYINNLKSILGKPKGFYEFKIGDIVFVKRCKFAQSEWPLGKVTKIYPGIDNVVRVVDVLFKNKINRESTQNLIPYFSRIW